jgi:Tfp pilus assembly PilM family ATPase
MAHTVCGIDLGTFSVKFVCLEVGFRTTTLRGLMEVPVPEGEAPLVERQLDAVREGLGQIAGEVTPYFAVPGDLLSVRVLELPFSDPRKIDQVVGYELEGQIVNAIEDVVFDHLVVGQRPEGATVLAAAAKRDEVAGLLAAADGRNIHPRSLFAASVIYRTLFPLPTEGPEPLPPPCYAVLDFGHTRTNVCVVRGGETIYARTIRRGGQHLTAAIAAAFRAETDRAEQAKRGEARLLSPGEQPPSPLAAKLDAVLRETLAPTVRELNQTLASFRGSARAELDALLVVGGGGQLAGLLPFLEAELGLPARHAPVRIALDSGGARAAIPDLHTNGNRPAVTEPGATEEVTVPSPVMPEAALASDSHALAGAIALAAARGSREIDFRRGPFVYRASFSVIRQKAWHLAALGVAVLLAAGFDVRTKLSSLGDERKDLDKELKTATTELFGKSREDPEGIAQLMRRGFKEELAPIPRATAFDLLDQISRKVPPADKVKLDVAELEIRPKKTFIKGTVDSGTAVDEIATKLKEIDCFDEITKGAITEVSGGAKQFSLTISSKCP